MGRQSSGPGMSSAVLHILLALAKGRLHGYGIMQEVKSLSAGKYRMGPGTLYDNLSGLLRIGLVAEVSVDESLERKLYCLTAAGCDALREEVNRLEDMVRFGDMRLKARTDAGDGV